MGAPLSCLLCPTCFFFNIFVIFDVGYLQGHPIPAVPQPRVRSRDSLCLLLLWYLLILSELILLSFKNCF